MKIHTPEEEESDSWDVNNLLCAAAGAGEENASHWINTKFFYAVASLFQVKLSRPLITRFILSAAGVFSRPSNTARIPNSVDSWSFCLFERPVICSFNLPKLTHTAAAVAMRGLRKFSTHSTVAFGSESEWLAGSTHPIQWGFSFSITFYFWSLELFRRRLFSCCSSSFPYIRLNANSMMIRNRGITIGGGGGGPFP